MTIIEQLTVQPPLPQIGATNWGPDLNDCLTWLYESVVANANSMQVNRDQIEALEAQVSVLEARVVTLEAKPEYVYSNYLWKFSNAAPPAASGELRLNHNDPSLATLIDVRKIDGDGADRTPTFQALTPGDKIRITDWDNATIIHRFTVTGLPGTMDPSNATIPVTWTQGSGILPTSGAAKINVGFLASIVV
jgi:hypothetical protein